ncbi:Uma2 family endonuclease [Allochromatium palmeri]|uniref:Uma2 family endonuclease n=2 Tax=Allochromatium palmeri TaxID=231048 RepID=A0A6N8E7M6_9GAMM|nr:Uma2 family endonuclease [Allochromatium palmeri]
MSNLAELQRLSLEEYLAGEEIADVKHEYIAGEVFAMAGATEEHVTISGNVFAMLRSHVRGTPCRVYMADMKLHVATQTAENVFYPDVFVTCSSSDASERQLKREPTLIIEVLSESTEAYDRGAKFAHYRQLETLREYVLIDSRRRSIEVFRRRDQGWLLWPVAPDEALVLESLEFACDQDAVYEDVSFD